MKDLSDKTVYVIGGSGDLGKEISKLLAAQGAHVTIFARRQGPLDGARDEILAARRNDTQQVDAVSVDMANAVEVETTFRAQPRLADIVYCVAGGTATQCGFLTDIDATDLDSCMRNNYFTSAYSAQSIFKIWTEDDTKAAPAKTPKLRQIVFINSAGAFVGLPGYTAYTPSKCAVRALADTLRMEAIRHSGPASRYTVHCAFPSNFITGAFMEEQKKKPELTKQIEGTTGSLEELQKRFPSAEEVACKIIAAVGKGEFAICDDSFESALLFSNMIGPSPKRGLGIVDSLLAVIVGLFVWPILRRQWDAKCKKDGEEYRQAQHAKAAEYS
ncbi:NAD(P)-binding protein [Corynespora cassiicola Philippines]|uniref:NAD(P)-binding protein n=1 Tax=Corynespora cassiicola Philippines TaxID=1448308 RepID=A0A2T2N3R9_CORCC|nr:NAD(P)-binding protein [Corynespora cassiicola Philippines]